jgi:hypothetical protein
VQEIILENKMTNLDKQLGNCERWKKAEKELKKLEESMKLIKQYPIKPIEKRVYSPPYQCNNFYNY